jgi:nucleotide-binding universal stress UspA family protein
MVYLKKILVTTDMSDYSLAAMGYASSFGLLYSSKLYLLYVADMPPVVPVIQGVDFDDSLNRRTTEEGIKKELEEFVSKRMNPDIKVTPLVRTGVPAEEIRRFAEEEGIDLIVMATHGRTGLKHIVMGSVAEKVVRISSIPVLTVKPRPMRESILKREDIESELHLW